MLHRDPLEILKAVSTWTKPGMEEKRKIEKQKEKDGHPGASVSLFKPEMTSFTRGEVEKNLHIGKD